jgi:hypothetical protein
VRETNKVEELAVAEAGFADCFKGIWEESCFERAIIEKALREAGNLSGGNVKGSESAEGKCKLSD